LATPIGIITCSCWGKWWFAHTVKRCKRGHSNWLRKGKSKFVIIPNTTQLINIVPLVLPSWLHSYIWPRWGMEHFFLPY
jgi:hypothetical protein